MNIPKKIWIAGVGYEVRSEEHLDNGVNLAYGNINYEESVIRLLDTERIGHQHKSVTVLHEILHGIQHHYGIELPTEDEERIIDGFARGLYQVLEENPLFEEKETL